MIWKAPLNIRKQRTLARDGQMIILKAKAGSALSYKGYNLMLPNLKKNWDGITFLYSFLPV